jgi:hypothetical protein
MQGITDFNVLQSNVFKIHRCNIIEVFVEKLRYFEMPDNSISTNEEIPQNDLRIHCTVISDYLHIL